MRPEIVLALLTRATQGLVLVAAAVCVVVYLSPAEQGVFFLYMSLSALLQMSDFGLAYATLQTASHLAHPGGEKSFHAFRAKAHRLNFGILLIAFILVTALGFVILSSRLDMEHPEVRWTGSWVAFMAAVFLTQVVNLELTLIEGGKSPPLAWAVRFFQELCAGMGFIAALISGAGLWSVAVFWMLRLASIASWLLFTGPHFPGARGNGHQEFDWRTEVWPFQWKIGLSVWCGFLIFQAFNPILLWEQGPVAAGKFGMSLTLMNMLLMITTVWPLSQAVRYGGLIRRARYQELRDAFWPMCIASTLTCALGALIAYLGLLWLGHYQLRYAERFADTATSGVLLVTAVAHHITHCFSVVFRAERRDPTMPFTIVGSLLLVVSIWACARYATPMDVALVNLGITLLAIPLVVILYLRRRARWTAMPEGRSV